MVVADTVRIDTEIDPGVHSALDTATGTGIDTAIGTGRVKRPTVRYQVLCRARHRSGQLGPDGEPVTPPDPERLP